MLTLPNRKSIPLACREEFSFDLRELDRLQNSEPDADGKVEYAIFDLPLKPSPLRRSHIPQILDFKHVLPPESALPVSISFKKPLQENGSLAKLYNFTERGTANLALSRLETATLAEINSARAALGISSVANTIKQSQTLVWADSGVIRLNTVASGLLVPTGSDKRIMNFLTELQSHMDDRTIASFVLEIEGAINPHFLRWLRGNYDEEYGPVPDLLVLYRINLPSGVVYRFPIKPCRQPFAKEITNPEFLFDADKDFINGIERFFSYPENRLSQNFFDGPKVECVTVCEETKSYLGAQLRWQSWIKKCVDSTSGSILERFGRPDWASAVEGGKEIFKSAFLSVLKEAPNKAQLMVTDDERVQISNLYADSLYELCKSEMDKLHAAAKTGKYSKLMVEGYIGPPGGYHLSFLTLAFDCIVDYKRTKRKSSDAGHLKQKSKALYQRNDLVQTIDMLPKALKSVQFYPRIAISVFDPLSHPESVKVYDYPKKLEEVQYEMAKFHLELLSENVSRVRNRMTSKNTFGRGTEQVSLQQDQFLSDFRDAESILMKAEYYYQSLQLLLNGDLAHAVSRDGPRFRPHKPRKEGRIIAGGIADFLKEAETELRQAQIRYLSALERIEPNLVHQYCKRINSITHDESVKFIYGIGTDEIMRFAYESRAKKILSHSDLMSGGAVLVAGQFFISVAQLRTRDFFEWERFWNDRVTNTTTNYKLFLFDNGTGHYGCLKETLPYARKVIFPHFRRLGIDVSKAQIRDVLQPGLKPMNWSALVQQHLKEAREKISAEGNEIDIGR